MKEAMALVTLVALAAGCSSLDAREIQADGRAGPSVGGLPIAVREDRWLLVKEYEDRIETEVIGPSRLFAVDLARPAAGSTDFAIEFASGSQYPSAVRAKVQDDTIKTLPEGLKGVVEALTAAANAIDGLTPHVAAAPRRLVRIRILDLRTLDEVAKWDIATAVK